LNISHLGTFKQYLFLILKIEYHIKKFDYFIDLFAECLDLQNSQFINIVGKDDVSIEAGTSQVEVA
jgi:hypothetical protein